MNQTIRQKCQQKKQFEEENMTQNLADKSTNDIITNQSLAVGVDTRNELRSTLNGSQPTDYHQMFSKYRQFLDNFEDTIEQVREKECYRIYLDDKSRERQYNELIEEQKRLSEELRASKNYTMSANRGLIEEIMNLQKLTQEYQEANSQYEGKIETSRNQLKEKRRQLKMLENKIKSYWVYNYDLMNSDTSRIEASRAPSNNGHSLSRLASEVQANKENSASVYFSKCRSVAEGSPNRMISLQSVTQISDCRRIDLTNRKFNTNLQEHSKETLLPQIVQRGKKQGNKILQHSKTSSIALSKELSLLNTSESKDKMLQKIEASTQARILEKLQYEKDKVNLLRLFGIYLKKQKENQNSLTEKNKFALLCQEIEEKANLKSQKLKQIEVLVVSEPARK